MYKSQVANLIMTTAQQQQRFYKISVGNHKENFRLAVIQADMLWTKFQNISGDFFSYLRIKKWWNFHNVVDDNSSCHPYFKRSDKFPKSEIDLLQSSLYAPQITIHLPNRKPCQDQDMANLLHRKNSNFQQIFDAKGQEERGSNFTDAIAAHKANTAKKKYDSTSTFGKHFKKACHEMWEGKNMQGSRNPNNIRV